MLNLFQHLYMWIERARAQDNTWLGRKTVARSFRTGLSETNRQIASHLTLGGFPLPMVMIITCVLTLFWLLALTADFVIMAEYFNTLFTTPYASALRAGMVVVLAITAGYLIEAACGLAPSPFFAFGAIQVRILLAVVGLVMMLLSLWIAGNISSQVYSALGPQVCTSETIVIQPELADSALAREQCIDRWDSNTLDRWTQIGIASAAVLGTALLFFAPITMLNLLCLIFLRLAEAFLQLFGNDSNSTSSST